MPQHQHIDPVKRENGRPRLTDDELDKLSNRVVQVVESSFAPARRAQAQLVISKRLRALARSHFRKHGNLLDFPQRQILQQEVSAFAADYATREDIQLEAIKELGPLVPETGCDVGQPETLIAFNGCGQTFVGKREFRPDSSYVTTLWFVAFFLPIFPLRSSRVFYMGSGASLGSSRYLILSESGLNWLQVIYVYGFAIGCICWLVFFPEISPSKFGSHPWWLIVELALIAAPAPLPYLLRFVAKRKLHG